MKNLNKSILVLLVITIVGITTGFKTSHNDIKPVSNNSENDRKNSISNPDLTDGIYSNEINSVFPGLNSETDSITSTWTVQTSGTANQLLTVSSVSSNVGWAAGIGPTVIRTSNGGVNWISATGTGITGAVYNICGIDGNNALCTSSPSATFIWKTSNGGTTWTQVYTQTGGFIDAIQMISSSEGYAIGDPVGGKWTVLKTIDGGNSWSRMATEPTQVGSEAGWNNSFQIVGTNMWFGTSSSKVYHSSDLGLTWSSSETKSTVNTYALHFNNSSYGFAGGDAMVMSSNSGESFSPVTSPGTTGNIDGLEGIVDPDDYNFIWGIRSDASVYRTTDNGNGWSIAHTQSGAVWQDIDFTTVSGSPQGWVVGNAGKIGKMSSTGPAQFTNDVSVTTNLEPVDYISLDSIPVPIRPKAVITNLGTATASSFNITYKVTGAATYTSTKTQSSLAPGSSATIYFDSTLLASDTGLCNVTIYTSLAADQNRNNDTLRAALDAITPNHGHGGCCSYYYANNIGSVKLGSRPSYSWSPDPTCGSPIVLNGVDVSGGRLVGNMDDGFFKFRLQNLLAQCGSDTALKAKICGICYDSIFISTNGLVGFTQKSCSNPGALSSYIPSNTNYPSPAILPLWMDLIFVAGSGSSLSADIVNNHLIINYTKVRLYSHRNENEFVSFQVCIELVNCQNSFIDPNFKFSYAPFNGTPSTLTSSGFRNWYSNSSSTAPNVGGFNHLAGYSTGGCNGTKCITPYRFYRYSGSSYTLAPKGPLFHSSPNYSNGISVEFGPSGFLLKKCNCGSTGLTLNLGSVLQGFYNPVSNSMVLDTITVTLRETVFPYAIVDVADMLLTASGNGTAVFSNASNGVGYYIQVNHRNSIETWSANPVTFAGDTLAYDFSTAANKAYGDNMIQVDASPVRFAVYSGDVNQDGSIDGSDNGLVDNDAYNFISGYVVTDVNGDGIVDASDAFIVDNNSSNFVSVVRP